MKWIELIRVRSTEETLRDALPTLRARVDAIGAAHDDAELFFLQHALYDGDLAVVLVWRNPQAPRKSRDGLLLASDLQRLGSIDHAVWVPAS